VPVRVANTGLKVIVFSISCKSSIRVAGEGLSRVRFRAAAACGAMRVRGRVFLNTEFAEGTEEETRERGGAGNEICERNIGHGSR
jgi:hypothetical protein